MKVILLAWLFLLVFEMRKNQIKFKKIKIKNNLKREEILYQEEIFFVENRKKLITHDYGLDYNRLDDSHFNKHLNHIFNQACGAFANVVFVILSNPVHFEVRNLIRRTYGRKIGSPNIYEYKDLNRTYSHCFVFSVGYIYDDRINSQIDQESALYEDLIRIPMIETYKLLCNKVMGSLYALNKMNKKFDYLFKLDDDMLIRIRPLIPIIYKYYQGCHIIGNVKRRGEVIRDPKDKYYIPYEKYGKKLFPIYPEGGGYAVRSDVLLNITQRYKKITALHFEDVNMGLVALDLNLLYGSLINLHHCTDTGDHYCERAFSIFIHANYGDRKSIIEYYKSDYE